MSIYSCAVVGCTNIKTSSPEEDESDTFFYFPTHDITVYKHWVAAIGRPNVWKPDEDSVVCADHFLESDFSSSSKESRKILNMFAVPRMLDKNVLHSLRNDNTLKRQHNSTLTNSNFFCKEPVIKLQRIDEILRFKMPVKVVAPCAKNGRSLVNAKPAERKPHQKVQRLKDSSLKTAASKYREETIDKTNEVISPSKTERDGFTSRAGKVSRTSPASRVITRTTVSPGSKASTAAESQNEQTLRLRSHTSPNQRLRPLTNETTATSPADSLVIKARKSDSPSAADLKSRKRKCVTNPPTSSINTLDSSTESETNCPKAMVTIPCKSADRYLKNSPSELEIPVRVPEVKLLLVNEGEMQSETSANPSILKSRKRPSRKSKQVVKNDLVTSHGSVAIKPDKPKSLFVLREDLPETLKQGHQKKIWMKTPDSRTLLVQVLDRPPKTAKKRRTVAPSNKPEPEDFMLDATIDNTPEAIEPEFIGPDEILPPIVPEVMLTSVPAPAVIPAPCTSSKVQKRMVKIMVPKVVPPSSSKQAHKVEWCKEAFYHDHAYYIGVPTIRRFSEENIIKLEKEVHDLKLLLFNAKSEITSLKKVVKLKSDRISVLNHIHKVELSMNRADAAEDSYFPPFEQSFMPDVFGQHFMAPWQDSITIKEEPL